MRAKTQTDKQRKLVQLVSENLGREKPMTMLDMMLAAGYEESTARQQSTILVGVREELEPIVAELEAHRIEVMKRMRKEFSKARYRDLSDSLDKLTKNIQLLSGKATDRHDNRVVSWNYIAPANGPEKEAQAAK
jgi:hypothetical protein